MNKKQSKKKPINEQLTKDALKELLTTLKAFLSEEVSSTLSVIDCRTAAHSRRIRELERIQQNQEIKRISYCSHEDKLDCVSYYKGTNIFHAVTYKCKWCGRESQKIECFLTKKEKKALKKLGVEI